MPNSLDNYKNAFPQILINLFYGIISTLYKERRANNRKSKSKSSSENKIMMITLFLSSIILSTAFKNTKVWITRTLASGLPKTKIITIITDISQSSECYITHQYSRTSVTKIAHASYSSC